MDFLFQLPMGPTLVQIAFNLGNAIGAFVGGVALTKTGQLQFPSLTGAILAAASVIVMSRFIAKTKREKSR